MKLIRYISIIIFMLSIISISQAFNTDLFIVKCTRVIDGDTMIFEYQNLPLKGRLKIADAFETYKNKHLKKQMKYLNKNAEELICKGKIAKNIIKNILEGKEVCIKIDKKHTFDYYGRYLVSVYTNKECQGETISDFLIKNKLAIYNKDLEN